MRITTLFLVVALTASGARGEKANSAMDRYLGLPVTAISYDPPSQPLPRAELDSLLRVKVGDRLQAAGLRSSIEALFATGRFREISIDAERTDVGVALKFITTTNWFVGRVTVTGVPEPPNRGQLISATKLTLGEEFQTEQLQQATENLKSRLEANGFFEPRINTELNYDAATEQVNVDFRVDPGVRAKLTDPAVEGLPPGMLPDFIRRARWKRWLGWGSYREVTDRRVQQGLDRVRQSYVKRDYLLNRITLNSLDYDAAAEVAKPDISVELGPKVQIKTEGAKVARGRLRQLVPVFQEQALDRDLVAEGQRNLEQHFQNLGYFRAEVDFKSVDESNGRRSIVYSIDPGQRYRLTRLEIEGNRYFSEKVIRERLNIIPATWLRYRRGKFSENLLESDLAAIRSLYQSNGFRDVDVKAATEENYQGKAQNLMVSIRITEGPQWMVSHHEVKGVSVEWEESVAPLISSVTGQPFSEETLATDRDNVLNFYYNQGYQNASFEWTVTPAGENQVDLLFTVNEGRRQFVRALLISGLETSNPRMVNRRMLLGPGDPLSQAKLVESQRRLYDLGVFARVDMAIQNPEGVEQGKYVLYQLEEARKYSLNFGLGAEITRIGGGSVNFDAPAGQPGFSPRVSFGVTRVNFHGSGHTIGLQSRASNIQQRSAFSYLAPQIGGRENTTLTLIGLFDRSRDVRTFQAQRLEGTLQLTERIRKGLTFQPRFTYRRNGISQIAIDPALVPIYSRPVRVGIVAATLYQDRRDDPIDSRRGYYNSIDFAFASKIFGSQTDYSRFLARNSSYHRLGKDLILARSTLLGWLTNLQSQGGADQIPLTERYFSGGATTHRGFPENQAGPRDLSTGFPLGGSGLLTNNVELRFPLLGDRIGGVIFHDAGNVYRSLHDISFRVHQRDVKDFDYMVHAVGFGLRYRTPVGPVRLDLAYSVNSPRFQYEPRKDLVSGPTGPAITTRLNRFQFHFSLGQTF